MHRRGIGRDDAKAFSVLRRRVEEMEGVEGPEWVIKFLVVTPTHVKVEGVCTVLKEVLMNLGLEERVVDGVLEGVTCLDVKGCEVESWEWVGKLKNLNWIDVSGNGLWSLPECIAASPVKTIIALNNPLPPLSVNTASWISADSGSVAVGKLSDYCLRVLHNVDVEVPWTFERRLQTCTTCPCCRQPFSWDVEDPSHQGRVLLNEAVSGKRVYTDVDVLNEVFVSRVFCCGGCARRHVRQLTLFEEVGCRCGICGYVKGLGKPMTVEKR